jgi:hypothetical protein
MVCIYDTYDAERLMLHYADEGVWFRNLRTTEWTLSTVPREAASRGA